MTEFNYFKADRVYNELYYQFPKVFLVSEEYRKMSDSTKIAYMLLKARLQAAIAKNQIDEEGNIYFTYTTKELCRVLNCQKQKAISIKEKLEEFGLLLQKDMGFNKKLGKQNPNRMYLAELNVSENDIYMLEKFDSDNKQSAEESQGMKIIPTQEKNKNHESIVAQEGMKIIPSQNADKSQGMKIKQVLNNSKPLDTDRYNIDSEKIAQQDQLLLENFEKIMLSRDVTAKTFIPERVFILIKTFSQTFEEAEKTVRTIHNAKATAEKETGTKFFYESLINYGYNPDVGLYDTLLRAYQKKRNEQVDNIHNVIFIYVKNWFKDNPIRYVQDNNINTY